MSTSELRRGPGWWMDLDGEWNPPEDWPEASPPLPGWVRTGSGRWTPPAETLGEATMFSPGSGAAAGSPRVQATGREGVDEAPSSLSYAETTADARPDFYAARDRRHALMAAATAGLTALMLAAGIGVLLAALL